MIPEHLSSTSRLHPEALLPVTLLARYIFFLSRRPVSRSNLHFRTTRLNNLQVIAQSIREKGDQDFERIIDAIRLLTSANLFRAAPEIEERLRRYIRLGIPHDFIVSDTPPSSLRAAQQVLLAFGPGIGIGDEILCFSLAKWIRQLAPACHITVLSWYDGLWSTDSTVQRVVWCDSYRTLLQFLRSEEMDAVFFVDFEDAGLTPVMARESAIRTYVEVSIGTRSVTALDRTSGYVHRHSANPEYFANFYRCVGYLFEWLGVSGQKADLAPFVKSRSQHRPTILVSPFTSKEDPSEVYWSRLIADLAAHMDEAQFLIEAGPNRETGSIARSITRAVSAAIGDATRCTVAHSPERPTITLPDILGLVAESDAVITADSYLAHAAPAYGRTALVLARQGLANWRVPSAGSFYFRASDSWNDVATSMRAVLRASVGGEDNEFSYGRVPECARLAETEAALRRLLDAHPIGAHNLARAWNNWHESCHAILTAVRNWPSFFTCLFGDHDYRATIPNWRDCGEGACSPDVLRHLRNRFQDWENSNLSKYVRAAVPRSKNLYGTNQ